MLPAVIDPLKDDRWDQFVCRNPCGSVYHLSHWMRVMSSAYGYQPFCVIFEEGGIIRGGIPFMRVDSGLTGKRVVSLPFTAYCRLLAQPEQLRPAIDCAMRHHSDIDYVEIRISSDELGDTEGCRSDSLYKVHLLDLGRKLEEVASSFHLSTRRSIKKAEKSGLELRLGKSEKDVETFYLLEVAVRKRHGLPPQPFRFFAQMWKALERDGLVYLPMVEFHGKVVAAAMMLKFNDTVHCEYSASDSDYLQHRPNHKLIWETIQMAHRGGVRIYDFGRTANTHSSLLMFKERWAAQGRDLRYIRNPETQRSTSREGAWRSRITRLNKFSPATLLRLQGEILYRHLG